MTASNALLLALAAGAALALAIAVQASRAYLGGGLWRVLVYALAAGAGAAAGWRIGGAETAAALAAGGAFAAGLIETDLRRLSLLDLHTAGFALAGLGVGLAAPAGPDFAAMLAGAAAGLAVFAGVRVFFERARGVAALGAGDILLAGACGIWTGWSAFGIWLLAACALAALLAIVRARGYEGLAKARIPLGAAMAASALAAAMFSA